MSIGVICRMNQARSIFVEGVLTKNFPELDFFSSGVEALSGSAPIDGVEELAKVWEIDLSKNRSSSIQDDQFEILEASSGIIIAATIAAFLGTYIGNQLLKKTSFKFLKNFVGAFLAIMGLLIIMGIL